MDVSSTCLIGCKIGSGRGKDSSRRRISATMNFTKIGSWIVFVVKEFRLNVMMTELRSGRRCRIRFLRSKRT